MATQPVSVHIFSPNCGHVHNTNCWCEPTRFYWLKDAEGRDIYVVEHNETSVSFALPSWVEQLAERKTNADFTL